MASEENDKLPDVPASENTADSANDEPAVVSEGRYDESGYDAGVFGVDLESLQRQGGE